MRAFVDDDRVHLVAATRLGGYEVVASASVSSVLAPNRRRATVNVAGGSTWEIRKDGGCGCHDPLKSMNIRRFLASTVSA